VRTPLRHLDAANGGSTPPAGLSVTPVRRQLELKLSRLAVRAPVVAQRRAARLNRALEHAPGRVENEFRAARRPIARREWMHAGNVQRLIDVDVSESGDEMLVEQERLHRGRPPRQQA